MIIGIYARKSVYRDNSDSVAVQVKSCKDYANLVFHGKEIEFRIYDKDEGFSGKDTNRPSFLELMQDVRSRKLDTVMVYKLDRISRSVKDFSETYETMHSNKVAFLSVKESFDTSTPIGRTVMYILAAFAQLERENTSERVSDSMYALGASGHWTGGRTPAGMTSIRRIVGEKEHSYLIVDEERIKLVKLIFELILSGYSITGVERYCKINGIKTDSGKFMTTSQIYFILTNPVYCANDLDAYCYFESKGCTLPEKSKFDGQRGLIGYGRSYQASGKKNDTYTIAIGIHAPVFTGKEWISVQGRLGINKMYRTAKYDVGILKGVLQCKCGSRMDIRNYYKNDILFSYYYCARMHRKGKPYCDSGYTRVDAVDHIFIEKLKEIKLNPESILMQAAAPLSVSTDQIRSDLRALNSSIENLTSALMGNMESAASTYIIAKIEKLDKERKDLEAALRKAEYQEMDAKAAAETREQIYSNICLLLDNFEDMSYKEKNELIRKTVKSCVFDGENLTITF